MFWSKQNSAQAVSVNNRATMRVWFPKGKNVGHVSLETSTHYVSWWPKNELGYINVVHSENRTLVDDIKDEGGQPDLVVTLYSLDVAKIDLAFADIQKTDCGYVLMGDKPTVRLKNTREGDNCCGMVYKLLRRGGIDKLTGYFEDLEVQYLMVRPMPFATFIKHAKERECALYPVTRQFKLLGQAEYIPDQAQHPQCNMI